MVFTKGEGLRAEEKWSYKGEKIEVVNRFKYLGYWFSSGNSERVQCEDIASKAQVAANVV